MSDDEAGSEAPAPGPVLSLGEMLLSGGDGISSAADWVKRNRHVTAIKAVKDEREAKAKGPLCAPREPHVPHRNAGCEACIYG